MIEYEMQRPKISNRFRAKYHRIVLQDGHYFENLMAQAGTADVRDLYEAVQASSSDNALRYFCPDDRSLIRSRTEEILDRLTPSVLEADRAEAAALDRFLSLDGQMEAYEQQNRRYHPD